MKMICLKIEKIFSISGKNLISIAKILKKWNWILLLLNSFIAITRCNDENIYGWRQMCIQYESITQLASSEDTIDWYERPTGRESTSFVVTVWMMSKDKIATFF